MYVELNDLQSCARGWLDRRDLKIKSKMTLRIQRAWRRYKDCQSLAEKTSAALLIQSAWRFSRAKHIYRTLTAQHKAATAIQSHFRKYMARKKRAAAIARRKSAAALLQTVLRAQAARKNISYLFTRCVFRFNKKLVLLKELWPARMMIVFLHFALTWKYLGLVSKICLQLAQFLF